MARERYGADGWQRCYLRALDLEGSYALRADHTGYGENVR